MRDDAVRPIVRERRDDLDPRRQVRDLVDPLERLEHLADGPELVRRRAALAVEHRDHAAIARPLRQVRSGLPLPSCERRRERFALHAIELPQHEIVRTEHAGRDRPVALAVMRQEEPAGRERRRRRRVLRVGAERKEIGPAGARRLERVHADRMREPERRDRRRRRRVDLLDRRERERPRRAARPERERRRGAREDVEIVSPYVAGALALRPRDRDPDRVRADGGDRVPSVADGEDRERARGRLERMEHDPLRAGVVADPPLPAGERRLGFPDPAVGNVGRRRQVLVHALRA